MTRLPARDARRLGLAKQQKYRSRKVELDGIVFDSRKEANRYAELRLLEKAGEIVKLELQPEFELQPGYRTQDGKYIRPIKYRADFRVTYADGQVVVIDTKGYRTKEYAIKKKMLLFRYPEIDFREE